MQLQDKQSMKITDSELERQSRHELLDRNGIFDRFFRAEAPRLAEASLKMSERFLAGGRLLAFGREAATTDAQHVSVEFVHPVIVGKRALPAMDLGHDFESTLAVLVQPEDMVMGFNFGKRSGVIEASMQAARERGALTFGLAGDVAEYSFQRPDNDPFVVQEIFEVLYHVLWETVHVYFEHREQGHDVGASSFLYPFLGKAQQGLESVKDEVQASMFQKMEELNGVRTMSAETQMSVLCAVAHDASNRLSQGGKLIAFGNGGSATDANDLVIDCLVPPTGMAPLRAVSLSAEPANITAVANDIGAEAIFSRQLIAQAQSNDVAMSISTSGSSPNILMALKEARERGLLTVALVGYDGGKVASEGLADHVIVVHCDHIPRIQEAQASLYHVLRRRIDEVGREEPSYA